MGHCDMESKLKPPRVGTLLRAAVFAGIALFSIKQPFNVMQELAKYPRGAPPAWFWPAVWGSMVLVVALCGTLAWRIAREAFPPKGTYVFPVIPEPRLTIIDVCTAPFAGLFLLILGLLPNMFVLPITGFGMRQMDVMQLVLMVPMGALLILWRPTYHVTDGQPLLRYPMGAWLPWVKRLPIMPKFEWREFFAGRPRRLIGWSMHATIGRFEMELDFVDLSATREQKSAVEARWGDVFSGIAVGTPEEQRAALADDKPVKPWHMMAAMVGIPVLVLGFGAAGQKHYDNTSVGLGVLVVLFGGASTLWFASRFVSEKVISVVALVLAVAAIGVSIRGRQRGEASALSNRIRYELQDVCDGKAARHPALADAPEFAWASADGSRWKLLGDEDDLVAMPRKMLCLRHSKTTLEARDVVLSGRKTRVERVRHDVTVELRDPATGALIATRTLEGGAPDAFPEPITDWRPVGGSVPTREQMAAAFQ